MLQELSPREEKFYASLPHRTKRGMLAVHVLLQDGVYYCLDLSIQAPTLDQLKADILTALSALSKDDFLPAAPRGQWEKLANIARNEIPVERWAVDYRTVGTRPVLFLAVVEK